jgi:hypothetical protein
MKVFTAPEKIDWKNNLDDIHIFLAGSIEMGKAEEWQDRVINEFRDNPTITFFNPRRKEWDSSWEQTLENPKFVEQLEWEYNQLHKTDWIFMYFSPETKSPISLLELGLFAHDNISVVCPKGFWRKGNVDFICWKHNISEFETIEAAIAWLKEYVIDV